MTLQQWPEDLGFTTHTHTHTHTYNTHTICITDPVIIKGNI